MGEVWRAVDELLGREVAVKLLHRHVAADPAFRERFRAEARITAGLTDAGIAQVFDYGESDGVAYLVMELVQGEPLSAILARNGALRVEIMLDVLWQASKGLGAAHRAGVIHRDIKPGNLLVTSDGLIKITDFGIARALEAASLTQSGTVMGTALYVSPEQAAGQQLTPSADIYSLGVVAYECLAGRTPFLGDTQVAIALQHINEPPPLLPDTVPGPVRGLVMAMLAKDPAGRPGSAREVGDRALVLRDSVVGAGTVELSTLTDPSGFGAQSVVATRTTIGAPPPPAPTGATRVVRTEAAPPPSSRQPGGRRTATVLLATAGCAAAVGLGAWAANGVFRQSETKGTGETLEPTVKATMVSPSVSPSPKRPRHTVTITSPKPSVTPSATVSTSAPSPSPTPSASPTPTSTPTPTPTPTPSDTSTPTTTPTVPEPQIGET
ncbi:serine/threonine protein kinase [Streptosporangiaceae bacterium NEAU-GS5]|nr:serine/threonine protein kinase [Streptosporangiaceae bacterium NEAU-GS5]